MGVDVSGAYGRVLARFRDTVIKGYAVEAEQTAKANAPWKDQTGDARKKLKGIVIDEDGTLGIALRHRVEYGKWLETANNGKYAILKPTLETMRARVFETFRKYFGGHK